MAFIAFLFVAFFSVFSVGCSAPVLSGADPTIELDGGSVVQDAGAPQREIAFSLHFAPGDVQPGDEGIHCIDIPGPAVDTWVSGWHVTKTAVHHTNVWIRKEPSTTAPWTKPTACGGGWGRGTFVLDSSRPDLVEALPPDVALKLPGGSSLIVDVHFLNTSDAPLAENVHVDFFDGAQHTTEASGLLLFGGAQAGPLDLQPGQTKTVTLTPTLPLHANNDLLTLIGHEHAHGVLETMTVDGVEVYRSSNWAEPPVLQPAPPIHVTPTSKVSWSCTYSNPDTFVVQWGPRLADTEMCQVFGLSTGPHWESQARTGVFQ